MRLIWGLLLGSVCFGQLVTITGTLTLPNGVPYNGNLSISWPVPFIGGDGSVAPAGPAVTTTISNGVINLRLESSTTSTPTFSYVVTYRPTGSNAINENWVVPCCGPTTITTVRQNQSTPISYSTLPASDIVGQVSVLNGGTGDASLSGILKGVGTSPITPAGAADVVGLFSGCTGILYLGADGACHIFPTFVYPGSGVANSTGSAWGTSYQVGTSANDLVQLNGSGQLPAVNGSLLTNLTVPTATTSTLGISKPDNSTISISSGSLYAVVATSAAPGIIQPDNTTLALAGFTGVLHAVTATSSILGVVKPDNSTINVVSGILSVPTATSSTLGLVEPDNSSITVSGGVISAPDVLTGASNCTITGNNQIPYTATTGISGLMNCSPGFLYIASAGILRITSIAEIQGTGSNPGELIMYDSTNTTTDIIRFDGTNLNFLGGGLIANGIVSANNGVSIIYRCTVAGTLPVGALTITSGSCGTAVDTGFRSN